MPQVAQCEDYDSDASVARPNTLVQARRGSTAAVARRPASRPPTSSSKPVVVVDRSSRRDVRAETGAVSPSEFAQGQNTVVVTRRSSSKSKPPVIHRVDSHHDSRGSRAPPARTPSRQSAHGCQDPNCGRVDCASSRNPERRYTLPHQYPAPRYAATPPPSYRPQQAPSPPVQQPPPQHVQYHYSQPNVPMAVPDISNVQPRPRSGSMARARPLSFSGYSAGYQNQAYGPPPAASAYYQQPGYYPHVQYQQYHQPAGYPGSTSTAPAVTYPARTSPSSPTYPPTSGATHTYSARSAQPKINGYELAKPQPQIASHRISARQQALPSARIMPGAFPDPESSEESSGSDSEEERLEVYREQVRERRRSRELMPPPRRPSVRTHYHSQPSVPSAREPLRRAPYSDPDLEYPSSSDYVDSDRTARAVVDRRSAHTSHYSSRSRRPSTSTTASSGRTKITTPSSSSGYVSTAPSSAQSHSQKVIVEDRHGRRAAYLSKEAQADLIRRIEAEKLQERQDLEDRVEAYQRQVRGAHARFNDEPELTAENIRRAQALQQQQSQPAPSRRPSATGSKSHVTSRTRRSESHASSTAKSKTTASASASGTGAGDGIKIQSGDTVLHVYGDAQISMRAGEDGGPAQFIIGSGPAQKAASEAAYSSEGGSEASSVDEGRSPVKGHASPVKGRAAGSEASSSKRGSVGKSSPGSAERSERAERAERSRRVRRSLQG